MDKKEDLIEEELEENTLEQTDDYYTHTDEGSVGDNDEFLDFFEPEMILLGEEYVSIEDLFNKRFSYSLDEGIFEESESDYDNDDDDDDSNDLLKEQDKQGNLVEQQHIEDEMFDKEKLNDAEEIPHISVVKSDTESQVDSKSDYETETDVSSSEDLCDFRGIFCVGDYSNKVLIIDEDEIEVVKSQLVLDNEKSVLFVLSKSAVQEIMDNNYHLDDLQYDVSKALGIEPEQLSICYLTKKCKNIGNLTRVELTKMLQPLVLTSPTVSSIKTINVKLRGDKNTTVTILNLTHGSEWLGGYKNSKGIYYHNATTQTEPKPRNYGQPFSYLPPVLVSRDTQTHKPYRSIGINLPIDHSTQMCRADHYIPADTDFVLSPRLYTSIFSNCKEIREKAAIVIQKFWRRYQLRKAINKEFKKIEELNRPQFDMITKKEFYHSFLNLIFPNKRKDFYKLHYLLNKYIAEKNKEFILIKDDKSRIAKLGKFLEILSEILRGMLKQSSSIQNDVNQTLGKTLLEYTSAPTIKINNDKDIIEIISKTGSDKWKNYKELFILFRKEDVNAEQRIEILLMFMDLIQNQVDFDMKKEILELMQRECFLIYFGVPSHYLSSLRKRMYEILYHCLKVIKYRFFQQPVYKCNVNIRRCKSCGKYKNIKNFPIAIEQKRITRCKSCLYIFRSVQSFEDISGYKELLRITQDDEYRRECCNPYLSLLTTDSIQYIVQKIWGSRSILSNKTRFSEFRLPRWDNTQPWAPWNCVLMTAEETKLHQKITNIGAVYNVTIRNIINKRLLQARLHFKYLIEMERSQRNIWKNLALNALNETTTFQTFLKLGDKFFVPPAPKKLQTLV